MAKFERHLNVTSSLRARFEILNGISAPIWRLFDFPSVS